MNDAYYLARAYLEQTTLADGAAVLQVLTDALKETADSRLLRVQLLLDLRTATRAPDGWIHPDITRSWTRFPQQTFLDTSQRGYPKVTRYDVLQSRQVFRQGIGVALACALARQALIPLLTTLPAGRCQPILRFLAVREMALCRLLGEPHLEYWLPPRLPEASLTDGAVTDVVAVRDRATPLCDYLPHLRRNSAQAGVYCRFFTATLPSLLYADLIHTQYSSIQDEKYPTTSVFSRLLAERFSLSWRLYQAWRELINKRPHQEPFQTTWWRGQRRYLGPARHGLVLRYKGGIR